MKNSRILSLILGLGILAYWPSSSHAAFIEPILGYSLETIEDTGGDDKHKAVYLGARAGMGLPMVPLLWFAVDGGITTGGTHNNGPTNVDSDADRTLVGASVGVNIPVVPIIDRVWAGYNFIDKLKFDDVSNTTLKGSSMKLGLGLKFVPFISLNIEYIITNYSKQEVDVTGETDIDTDAKTILVSVSLPLP